MGWPTQGEKLLASLSLHRILSFPKFARPTANGGGNGNMPVSTMAKEHIAHVAAIAMSATVGVTRTRRKRRKQRGEEAASGEDDDDDKNGDNTCTVAPLHGAAGAPRSHLGVSIAAGVGVDLDIDMMCNRIWTGYVLQ